MNDIKAARPSKRARLNEEGPLCSWRANYHVLFNTFTLSRTHVLCHNYCQVHQLRLHWENAERLPMQFNFVDFVVALACSKTNYCIDYFLISVRWLISIQEEPYHDSKLFTHSLNDNKSKSRVIKITFA